LQKIYSTKIEVE